MTSTLRAVLVCFALLPTSAALAQQKTVVTPPPEWRVDVVVSAGMGLFTAPAASYTRGIATLAADVRFASLEGHGAMFRVGYGTDVWGDGTGADLAYLHRSRLIGDDRRGLGLDVFGGATLAALHHNDSTIPHGLQVGGNLGASLTLRFDAFVLDLGVQYRLLLPTQGTDDHTPTGPEHVLTATLGIGFGANG